ncbi:MAG: ATP synthase F0 subunit B [Butyrivibrio sp.]|nr:ATP synthase F0 subunit B [Butyrivibrio sp.]
MLNISIANIIYTIINLLILFFLMKKFLFGRVDQILGERASEIEAAKKSAEQIREESQAKIDDYNAKFAEIERDRDRLMSEAREMSGREYDEVIANARKEAARIVEDAKKAAQVEARRERDNQATQLENLVLDAARKISSAKHDEESDRKLYDEFIRMGEQEDV